MSIIWNKNILHNTDNNIILFVVISSFLILGLCNLIVMIITGCLFIFFDRFFSIILLLKTWKCYI